MSSAGRARKRRLAVLGAIAATLTGAQAQTPSPEPTPSPWPSMTKTFVIEPEQSDQTFRCENGHVQSALTYTIGEHRIVSIVFVDKAGATIPSGVWSEAFGFRLLHRQTVKIEAAMICGG